MGIVLDVSEGSREKYPEQIQRIDPPPLVGGPLTYDYIVGPIK